MPLTDSACKNAKPKPKPYKINDGDGLWLFINPNGKKYWRFKYTYHQKENTLSFGNYPIVSLSQARDKRKAIKETLEAGDDPSLLRKEKQQVSRYNASQTFEVVAREWHKANINNWSDITAARIMRRMEDELFPDLGIYPFKILPRKVLLACLQKAASRSPELGKRLLDISKQICEYAGLTDRLEKDLTVGLKAALPKYIVAHYACLELEQLPDFIKALYAPPQEKNKLFNQATRLLLLFGCRTMELLNAQRSEFNIDNKLWIINSERMKKSAEQRRIKRDHLVPLSKQAIAILLELDREYGVDRKFLLPSKLKRNQSVSKQTILSELERIKYKSIMTGHGFRSLLMTVGTEELGFKPQVVDRQLAHVPRTEVMRSYDRAKYLKKRTKLMQSYADYIDNLVNPKKERLVTENLHNYIFQRITTSYAMNSTTDWNRLTPNQVASLH